MKHIVRNLEEYHQIYKQSIQNPSQFWGDIAEDFHWFKKWEQVKKGGFENLDYQWFVGGKTNIAYNCLDHQLKKNANKTAIIWEPNDPNTPTKTYSYNELHLEVSELTGKLRELGVSKGDRVCLYMPMVPELAFAVLACARIGAIHSVVFAGFSSDSLAGRIQDCHAKFLITADGAMRGNKQVDLKGIVDEALKTCPSIEKNVVLQHINSKVAMKDGRDVWWSDLVANKELEFAEEMDAEDPLFILYTSGSTGKPKGIVHSTGGYMVYTAYSFANVFQYREKEVYWCTADIGWVTGHSYIVYGPLLNGATTLMFEGIPTYPDAGRFWEVCDKHQVNIFYTAPTAIRALMAAGDKFVDTHQLNSLRVLGSVGEPINAEAWHWYNEKIGKGICPIVDTWWQTETGGIMISPLAGVTPTKPTFATLPLPGIEAVLMDENGKEIMGNNVEGRLCLKHPWPSIARGIYGDQKRFKDTYFSTFQGKYFSGDGCRRDEDGYYRITGRVDDIIISSGHNLGTAEIENAINMHPKVVESAVVGFPHDIKGNGIFAFVICESNSSNQESLQAEITKIVSDKIGPIAKPDKILLVRGLPKTRSGKIMRRILRKLAAGEADQLGDISTLLNPEVVEELIGNLK